MTSGGEGVSGFVQSYEHKRKAADSRRNSKKWWEGNARTAEKLRGRKHTDEHRQKISEGHKGKVLSNVTKERMSESKKSCPKALAHILSIVEVQKDKNIHTFHNKSGEVFLGTREELSKHSGITLKNIAKLFTKVNTRQSTYGWSLTPFIDPVTKANIKEYPKRSTSQLDNTVYTFYHNSGETFIGTRKEFSDYFQFNPSSINGLFRKNPRSSLYGWSVVNLKDLAYS